MPTTHGVTVVGAGPTGLLLAAELALAGVHVEVVERRASPILPGTRARGFHARTTEILDQRGLADRFLRAGRTVPALQFADTPLPVGDLPTRHPYTLAIGQETVERLLLERVDELGVPVHRGVEVIGLAQDEHGVEVKVAGGGVRRTAYLVGADGGRSVVRRAAGITLDGAPATRSYLLAEVSVSEPVPTGIRLDDTGIHAVNVQPDGTAGVVVTEAALRTGDEPTLEELADALTAVFGSDLGVHGATWISRFTDATRQATAYRRGRVLLAGDAAHVHPPTGGQGIGLGAQDAVNLGWKLGQVVRGVSPAHLLDTYERERRAATARVLDNVMVQAMLQRGDRRTVALRDAFALLLRSPAARLDLAALLTGLDERHEVGDGYPLPGDGHPLPGRRVPDLDLVTDHGPRRVFELLHAARPVLLDLVPGGDPALASVVGCSADRVRLVLGTTAQEWVLPVVGPVPAPAAVLVRPDGHVAWVGEGTTQGLEEALRAWCGEPIDRTR